MPGISAYGGHTARQRLPHPAPRQGSGQVLSHKKAAKQQTCREKSAPSGNGNDRQRVEGRPACRESLRPAGHGGSGEIISPEKRFLLPAVRLRAGASPKAIPKALHALAACRRSRELTAPGLFCSAPDFVPLPSIPRHAQKLPTPWDDGGTAIFSLPCPRVPGGRECCRRRGSRGLPRRRRHRRVQSW